MLNKWLNRWKRCSGNEKPLKLIKEWYSSCEYVDSWRGVHLHLGGRGSINLPCTTMGVWLSLYVRGLTLIIIHSKYFPNSDWLKAHVQFTITSYWWPNLEEIWLQRGNDVKNAAFSQVKAPLTEKTWGRGWVVLVVNLKKWWTFHSFQE